MRRFTSIPLAALLVLSLSLFGCSGSSSESDNPGSKNREALSGEEYAARASAALETLDDAWEELETALEEPLDDWNDEEEGGQAPVDSAAAEAARAEFKRLSAIVLDASAALEDLTPPDDYREAHEAALKWSRFLATDVLDSADDLISLAEDGVTLGDYYSEYEALWDRWDDSEPDYPEIRSTSAAPCLDNQRTIDGAVQSYMAESPDHGYADLAGTTVDATHQLVGEYLREALRCPVTNNYYTLDASGTVAPCPEHGGY